MRHWLTARLPAVLLCWLLAPMASAAQYAVIVPGNSTLTQRFVDTLGTALPDATLVTLSLGEAIPVGTDAVITMGRSSLDDRLSRSDALPTLATYITGESLQDYPQAGRRFHSLLANPKPARQVALARLLVPGARRMGILISTSTRNQLSEWQLAAERSAAKLVSVDVTPEDNLTRQLVDIITDSDILLGTDDSQIYNADNLKSILLTSYSRNKVLIGPSAPFIQAGSLSTTYSTPDDMARSAAALLSRGLPDSGTTYPQYFSVLSNAQVARSLGIPLPDDATLASRLAELEQAQ
ncbi:hypothetical protein [Halopseudomonas oceani]|uniref:hypothetical protein n=1 Tax=Halopseudomonas oceani TaxID=1708783 RepID=UPI002AA62882|nr:hypothetical protein [Halopseudomonas oceani]